MVVATSDQKHRANLGYSCIEFDTIITRVRTRKVYRLNGYSRTTVSHSLYKTIVKSMISIRRKICCRTGLSEKTVLRALVQCIAQKVCVVVSTIECGVDEARKVEFKQFISRLPRVFNVRSRGTRLSVVQNIDNVGKKSTRALRTRASRPSVRQPAVMSYQPSENRGLDRLCVARTLLLVMNSNTPSLAMTINLSCLVTLTTSCSGSAYTPTVSPIESPRLLHHIAVVVHVGC